MAGIFPYGTDARLVRNTLAGNKDAFGRLVERHLPTVEAIAMAYTRNWTDAEDLCQDAFIKAYQSLDTLRDASKFSHWMSRIVRNAGLNRATRKPHEHSLTDTHVATLSVPAHDHAREELVQLIDARLAELPPDYREVLLLHYYAGMSLREIAAHVGTTRDAAAKRLQRGRDMLTNDLFRVLGIGKKTSPRDNRARTITAGVLAATAAWQETAAANGVATGLFTAALLKPTIAASLIASAAFVGFLTYIAVGSRTAEGIPRGTGSQPVSQASHSVLAQNPSSPAATPTPKPKRATTGPGSITATVTAGKGAPAAGATVTLELIDWPEFTYPPSELLRKEVVTDESGVARFTNLPLGEYGVIAVLGKTTWGDGVVLTNGSTHADAPLPLRPGMPVDGIVVDSSGVPVPNATVYAHSSPWISYVPWGVYGAARMMSDENGIIHKDVLPQMPMRYCVVAEGYAPTLTGVLTHGKSQLQMIIQRGGAFSGAVIDSESGNPVPRIAMTIKGDAGVRFVPLESDDTGAFTSPQLQPGSYQIIVTEEGYTDAGPTSVEVAEGEVTGDISVRLFAGGTMSGFVRDGETGEGIRGATVTAQADGFASRTSSPSDASGAYVIFGLARATYTAYLSSGVDTYFSGESRAGIAVEPAQEVENINFSITRGLLIKGRVVENDGRGATTAYLYTLNEDGQRIGGFDSENAGGAFQLLLKPDTDPFYLKACTLYGSTEQFGPIDVTGEDMPEIVLRATIARSAGVEGTVVNASGTPLPYAFAWCIMESNTNVSPIAGKEVFADQSGHFSVSGLHPDVYHIVAGFDRRDHAQSEGVTIDLRAGHVEHGVEVVYGQLAGPVIAGRVTNSDGQPIVGAEIGVQSPSYGLSTTDTTGEFKIARTMEGSYRLKISHADYSTVYLEPLDEDASAVSVIMEKRASIEGRVVNAATGKPIDRFEVLQSVPDSGESGSYRPFSDPDGKFKLGKAESGRTELRVRAQGFQPETLDLDLAPEESATIVVELHPGGVVRGVVVSDTGDPVSGAMVSVELPDVPTDEQPYRDPAQTAPDGTFTLQGLPAEPLRLIVRGNGFGRATAAVVPVPGEETSITIQLPTTAAVDVNVNVNDQPARGAYVMAVPRDSNVDTSVTVETNDSGKAELSGLVSGPYKIIVQLRVGNTASWFYGETTSFANLDATDAAVHLGFVQGTGSVTGIVTQNEAPVIGELVGARTPNGALLLTYSQSDGSYRLDGLPETTVSLSCGPSIEELALRRQVQTTAEEITQADIEL